MTTGWLPDDLLALIFRGELGTLCRRENGFHTTGWSEWSGMYSYPEHIPLTARGVCPRQCCPLRGCLSSFHALEENLGIWFGGVIMIWRCYYNPVAMWSLVEISANIIRFKKIAESMQSQIHSLARGTRIALRVSLSKWLLELTKIDIFLV